MARRRMALLLALMLLLSGCWSRLEINDLGLVMGMAVDVGEEAPVRVTLYFARGRGQTEDSNPAGGAPVWVATREAENLADAMREIALASARRISLHHMQVVLLGDEYARSGIGDLLDFLARHPQIRLNMRPMVVRGRAQTVLETVPLLKSLQPQNLVAILEAKGGVDWRLKNFLVARVSDSHSGWMHALRVVDRPGGTPGSPPTAAELDGAALFLGDRLVALMDARLAQALSWLLATPRNSVISAPCPEDRSKSFSVTIDKASREIEPIWSSAGLRIRVGVEALVDLTRLECRDSILEEGRRQRLEEQLSEDVVSRFEGAVELFQANGVDPAGFGHRVKLRYPASWRSIAPRWSDIWREVPVEISAKLTIHQPGLLLEPAHKTEQEMHQAE